MSKSKKYDAKQIRKMSKHEPAKLVQYIEKNKLPWGKTLADAGVAQINCFKIILERYIGDTKTSAEIVAAIGKMAPHCNMGTLQSYLPWFARSPKSVGRPCPHAYMLIEFSPKTYTIGRRNDITESIGDALISQSKGQGKGPKVYENLAEILNATQADIKLGKVKAITAKPKAEGENKSADTDNK